VLWHCRIGRKWVADIVARIRICNQQMVFLPISFGYKTIEEMLQVVECLHPNKFFLVILKDLQSDLLITTCWGCILFQNNLKIIYLLQELKIYLETIISQQQNEWELAMEDEYKFFFHNHNWILIDLSLRRKVMLMCKRVFCWRSTPTMKLQDTRQEWWQRGILNNME
jgi:hypothetical protein